MSIVSKALPLTGMEGATGSAGACFLVAVEPFEHRRQIGDDVTDLQFDRVNSVLALRAIPHELLCSSLLTDTFDHDPDRFEIGTLGRMWNVSRQHPHAALGDVHTLDPIVGHQVDVHGPPVLVEPLLVG